MMVMMIVMMIIVMKRRDDFEQLSLFECFMHKTYVCIKLKKLSFPIRAPFYYSLTQAILLVSLLFNQQYYLLLNEKIDTVLIIIY